MSFDSPSIVVLEGDEVNEVTRYEMLNGIIMVARSKGERTGSSRDAG